MEMLDRVIGEIGISGTHLERLLAVMCLNSKAKNDALRDEGRAERERAASIADRIAQGLRAVDPDGHRVALAEEIAAKIREGK